MTDFTNLPTESFYEGSLSSPISSSSQTAGIVILPLIAGTISGTQRMTILNPAGPEIIEFTGQDAAGELTGVTRGIPKYIGGPSTARQHSGGLTCVISDPIQLFEDVQTAIASKANIDLGNVGNDFAIDTSSGVGIRDDSGVLKLKDSTQAEVDLATLASLAGVNDKYKVSVDDTTEGYDEDKKVYGDGLTATTLNPGANEQRSVSVELDATPGLEFSAAKLKVKVKSGGGITLDADGLSIAEDGDLERTFTADGVIAATQAVQVSSNDTVKPMYALPNGSGSTENLNLTAFKQMWVQGSSSGRRVFIKSQTDGATQYRVDYIDYNMTSETYGTLTNIFSTSTGGELDHSDFDVWEDAEYTTPFYTYVYYNGSNVVINSTTLTGATTSRNRRVAMLTSSASSTGTAVTLHQNSSSQLVASKITITSNVAAVGNQAVFAATGGEPLDVVRLTDTTALVAFVDNTTLYFVIVDTSGVSPVFGTAVAGPTVTAGLDEGVLKLLPNGNAVFTTDEVMIIDVGSGTTVNSVGTPVALAASGASAPHVFSDYVVAVSTSDKYEVFSIDDTTVTLVDTDTFSGSGVTYGAGVVLAQGHFIRGYSFSSTDGFFLTSYPLTEYDGFAGFAVADIADTGTGIIDTLGFVTTSGGLTAGTMYYLNAGGGLESPLTGFQSLAEEDPANLFKLGVAINETEIRLTN